MTQNYTTEIKKQLGKEYFIAVGAIYASVTFVKLLGGLTDEQYQFVLLLLLSTITNFSIPILGFFIKGEKNKTKTEITKEGSQILLGVARVYGVTVVLINIIRVAPVPTLHSFSTYFTLLSTTQAIFSVWLSWILSELFENKGT